MNMNKKGGDMVEVPIYDGLLSPIDLLESNRDTKSKLDELF
jgi:hypothetical protein